MVDLGDLEIFAKVVATRSMSSVARSMGVSAAVISKRIKRLEETIGVRLLQRTTRQIAVTEAGQEYYDRVLDIIERIDEAELVAAGKSSAIAGNLRIAAPTSFGRMHIAPHLPAFMVAHPELSVELILSDALTDIVAEKFDLAIRISELKDSVLIARKLASVRRVLCASPQYLSRAGTPLTLEDLAAHQCIASHNGEAWRLQGPEGAVTLRPSSTLKTNSSEVVREAVIAGLGIALRSTWDVGEELASGRLVQVLPDYQSSKNVKIAAVFPSRQFLPAKVRVFIDYLQGVYGPVPYWEKSMGARG